MSCSLPPELLDHIVDHLHDDPTALEACCVVAKSWVPRARSHLFARVEFDTSKHSIEQWMRTFPDPSNSPALHTRKLTICGIPVLASSDVDIGDWIRSFHNLVDLHLDYCAWEDRDEAIIPFYGLSPTVRSLRLTSTSFEVFGLICSFPLLEDLAVLGILPESSAGRNTQVSSPKLTGSLDLRSLDGICSVARRLLDFPNGLHFTKITLLLNKGDAESATDLVSKCSGTLESLTLYHLGAFPSASMMGRIEHLTTARWCRKHCNISPRPLQGHKTQRSDVSVQKVDDQIDHHGAPNRWIQEPSTNHCPPIYHQPRRPN